MATASKKPKKSSAKKSQKKAGDDRIFNYVLIGVGILIVIGLVVSIVIQQNGNAGTASTGSASSGGTSVGNASSGASGGMSDMIVGALGKGPIADKLASLGFTNPVYDPSGNDPSKAEDFRFIVDQNFLGQSQTEQKKRMEEVGQEMVKLLNEHLGDSKTAYVMFHTDESHMMATWTPQSGVQFLGGQ